MAIYQPELLLSQADREALSLLGQLALASDDHHSANLGRDTVPLSPSDAFRLLELLERFAGSKLFAEGSYFSEGISRGEANVDDRLKNIYLSWRSRRGFTNVFSVQRWREFILRAGFDSSEAAWMWPSDMKRSPLRPMKLEHFVDMEARLASAAGLNPRVQQLIVAFVRGALPNLRALREREVAVPSGALGSQVRAFISDLSDHVRGREREPMSRRRIIALSTIVMDTATLFATRDWTAAGVLSSMAAVVPDAAGYEAKE